MSVAVAKELNALQSRTDLLRTLEQHYAVPADVVGELRDGNALPRWFQPGAPPDWLEWLVDLHFLLRGGWSQAVVDASIVAFDRSAMNSAVSAGGHIGFFRSTDAYLRELLQIMLQPLAVPPTDDPNALMLVNPEQLGQASERLALLLGMLEAHGYSDGAPAGSRGDTRWALAFLHFHEVGHLLQQGGQQPHIDLLPEEEEFRPEMEADAFALSILMALSASGGSSREEVLSGIASAMALTAAREYAETFDGARASIRSATHRTSRLLYWSELIDADATKLVRELWELYDRVLSGVESIPDPVSALLDQAGAGGSEAVPVAKNLLVKWCAFGDCQLLGRRLHALYAGALPTATENVSAARVVCLIDAILVATEHLEPQLGLRAHLGAIPPIPAGYACEG